MKKFLALLFAIAPLSLFGAPGDIVSAHIETNGWVLHLEFQGMTNKGTFVSGLTTDYRNLTGTNSIELLLSDSGYNGVTAANPVRKVYVTRQIRSPYPNQSSNEFYAIGTNCWGRFALSDWVYKDTVVTSIVVRAGAYTDATRSNLAFTSTTVTNNSTNEYVKPIANWISMPWRRGGTANVEIVAWDHHPKNGESIAGVKFWTTDQAGNSTSTQAVTSATGAFTKDGIWVEKFVANYSLVGLNEGIVSNHFEVFPHVGTNTAHTDLSGFTFPSYQITPQPMLCDTNGDYGTTFAWVDPLNGNDSTGIATTNALINYTNKFLTVAAAKNAMMRTNWLLFSRPTPGAGFILLTNGTYSSVATPVDSNAVPATWCYVMPDAVSSRELVVVTNNALALGQMICYSNITISSIRSASSFSGAGWHWFANCKFTNCIGSTLIGTVTNVYLTDCDVNNVTQGMYPVGSNNTNYRLFRGNSWDWFVGNMHHSVFVGNFRQYGTNGALILAWTDSTTHEPPSYPIIAYNVLKGQQQGNSHMIQLTPPNSNMRITNGFAVIQNVIETVGDLAGDANNGRLLSAAVSTSAGDTNPVERAIVSYNTFAGARGPHGWDNASSGSSEVAKRQGNVMWNNATDNMNFKSDQVSSANAAHLGSWPLVYGVGFMGNVEQDPAWMDSGWVSDHGGISSIMATNTAGRGLTSQWATAYMYVNRQTASGLTNVIEGRGDYRLQTSSQLFRLNTTKWGLKRDIEGKPRGTIDPPGAYTAGNAKKGAFF